MENYMGFSSDKPNVFFLLIDKSGSMEGSSSDMERGLRDFKKSMENFSESNSIAISISKFSDSFYPEAFTSVENIDTEYDAYGGTALFSSIVKGAEYLNRYIQEIIAEKGTMPNATFFVLSDGEPSGADSMGIKEGKETIENLNYQGITTVFVAFGNGIESELGRKCGFMSVLDVKDRDRLAHFFGVELSQSCKEQSMSVKGLGANFFSQAVGEQSEEYSSKATQALEDESWWDDI